MSGRLTIREIARQLCDGLDKDLPEVEERLQNYAAENSLTLEELNEKCWEDSAAIFDEIFG